MSAPQERKGCIGGIIRIAQSRVPLISGILDYAARRQADSWYYKPGSPLYVGHPYEGNPDGRRHLPRDEKRDI